MWTISTHKQQPACKEQIEVAIQEDQQQQDGQRDHMLEQQLSNEGTCWAPKATNEVVEVVEYKQQKLDCKRQSDKVEHQIQMCPNWKSLRVYSSCVSIVAWPHLDRWGRCEHPFETNSNWQLIATATKFQLMFSEDIEIEVTYIQNTSVKSEMIGIQLTLQVHV